MFIIWRFLIELYLNSELKLIFLCVLVPKKFASLITKKIRNVQPFLPISLSLHSWQPHPQLWFLLNFSLVVAWPNIAAPWHSYLSWKQALVAWGRLCPTSVPYSPFGYTWSSKYDQGQGWIFCHTWLPIGAVYLNKI